MSDSTADPSAILPNPADALAGRRALVTGGGTGMGEAMAKALAALGVRVVVCGRRTEPLEETVEEIKAAGGEAFSIPGDVANAKGCARLIEQSTDLLDGLDLLINNAGIARSGPFADLATEDVDAVIDIDLKGPIHLTQAALPHLRTSGAEGRGPAILNISSSVTQIAVPNYAVYAAAKAGLNTLTKCLALELAADRIRVNAICPGVVRTPIFETMMPEDEAQGFLDSFGAAVPLGRIGEPGDISRIALPLLSPQNDWITGAIVTVDGGVSLGSLP